MLSNFQKLESLFVSILVTLCTCVVPTSTVPADYVANTGVFMLPVQILRPMDVRPQTAGLQLLGRGVWLKTTEAALVAIAFVNNRPVELCTASSNEQLRVSLDRLVDDKMQEIETSAGVRISRENETFAVEGSDLIGRKPSLAELLSLNFALQHSTPCACTHEHSKQPLQICFLESRYRVDAIAEWTLDRKGKPIIFVEPSSTRRSSLESVLLHELAHHSQFRNGLNPTDFGSWKVAKVLGWKSFENPTTGQKGWSIMCAGGKLFKQVNARRYWVRCNDLGQPLTADGERASKFVHAETATEMDVLDMAIVRPATGYFTSPAEVLAEAMMLFRMSEESRKSLEESNPLLYTIVQNEDQRELDRIFGKGKMVRTQQGLLAHSAQ